jgi:hypothetical protein
MRLSPVISHYKIFYISFEQMLVELMSKFELLPYIFHQITIKNNDYE